MAKGFKKGVGGANPLNFKVVGGTTEPSNPRKNMIWINTDQKITSWFFTATEPTNPAEGTVWLVTSASSSAPFNALKKNGIQVYVIGAKQYISGAWVTKEVKYTEGTGWADVILYLYNHGDDCNSVTGGWEASSYSRYNSQTKGAPSLSMGSSTMSITFKECIPGDADGGTVLYGGSVWTKKAIDLTNISTLYITVNSYSNVTDAGSVYFIVTKTKQSEPSVAASVTMSKSTSAKTYSLNVRDLSGEYYITLMNYVSYPAIKLVISSISGE